MSKNEFDQFLFLGKKYLEYFIYVKKTRNIDYCVEFNEEDIRIHTITLCHFLNDMGTNKDQETLSTEELLKEGMLKDMLVEAEKLDAPKNTEKSQSE